MAKSILVVDDSSTIRKFVSVSLSLQGFDVLTACDGMDALEKLPTKKVDLVITDLNMPNMDGFEFIKALRENSEYQDVPVIVLTSLPEEKNKEIGVKLGVTSYVMKPFKPEKIQYEVSKCISSSDM
ncbi:MAG: response regulator [Ignavibacteria bacterium]|nr:response regulator [Ignavibacteria bacterium]